jgi:cytidylate kinase
MAGKINIAIDGPAGSGKSTVARGVARALGYAYVDTGAMYRAVTLLAMEKNVSLDHYEALTQLAKLAKIDIINNSAGNVTVLLNGTDVSEAIRTPEVTKRVSDVAKVPGVRAVLVATQKKMALTGGVVMEGRDIGTVVLTDAPFKFYIVASARERAARRSGDLQRMGFKVDIDELAEEIRRRDSIDSSREVDPLKPAGDAVIIDSTGMTAEEVIAVIVKTVTEGLS